MIFLKVLVHRRHDDFVVHLEDGWKREISELKYLAESLELILNNVYSGIIFCDKECKIIFMNTVYADLLGVDRKEAEGKSINEFFPNSRLPSVLSRGRPELGQRCSLRGEMPFLVNRIPIKRGNETIGIILQSIFNPEIHGMAVHGQGAG